MFDRFTDRARKVMKLARHTAQDANCEYIGGEHILIGIAKESSGVGANALRNLDVSADKLEAAYKEIYPAGPSKVTMGELPFTPVARQILEYSVEEASNLGHNYIGTEHLLLAITRIDGSYGAVKTLEKVGVSQKEMREELLELLGAALDNMAGSPAPLANPVVTLIKRRLEILSVPSRAEQDYGAGFAGPRLAAYKELKDLLADIKHLKV